MKAPRTVVVRFQVPIREDSVFGNGELHPQFRWKDLQKALQRLFKGWTRPSGYSEGAVLEPVRSYESVAGFLRLNVAENRLPEIRGLLRSACVTFRQQCIRMDVRGEVEYIEGGPSDEEL